MTQGIRAYANTRFAAHLPKLADLGPTAFRKKVMDEISKKWGISVASAATHYNHALKQQRLADPKSVDGLGRPEDKKGGRKAVHTVDVVKVKSGEVVATGISRGAAQTLIATAIAKKKPKLAIKGEEVAA